MLLDVLCPLTSEQVTRLPRSIPRARWKPLLGLPGARTARPGQLDRGDEGAYFSSLQAVGTSAAAPAPASKPSQLKPKSAQVVPIEEFQGKGKAPGRTSPPLAPLSSPPLENNDAGRSTHAWFRKPSRSSWVKVKLSLSSLSPLPKGAESRYESEAQWAGTAQAEQQPEIVCPGSPGGGWPRGLSRLKQELGRRGHCHYSLRHSDASPGRDR